jgi:hypothetical protein
MGARDLYVAEVYDVEADGSDEEALWPRVLYEREVADLLMLTILDQQAGVRNASTFQAWGRPAWT